MRLVLYLLGVVFASGADEAAAAGAEDGVDAVLLGDVVEDVADAQALPPDLFRPRHVPLEALATFAGLQGGAAEVQLGLERGIGSATPEGCVAGGR
jgi:hypothetical protein